MRKLQASLAGENAKKSGEKRVGLKNRLRVWEAPQNANRKRRVGEMVAALRKTAKAAEARRAPLAARAALLRLNPMTVKVSQKEAFSTLMREKNAEAKRLSKSVKNVIDAERGAIAREDALMVSLSRTAESVASLAEAFGDKIALPTDFPENIASVRNFSADVERGVVRQGDVSGLRDYADFLTFQAEEVLSKRPGGFVGAGGAGGGGRANSGEARALREAVVKLEKEKKNLEARLKTRGNWMRVARRDRRRLLSRIGKARGERSPTSGSTSASKSGSQNVDGLAAAFAGMRVSNARPPGPAPVDKKRSRNSGRSARSGEVPMNWYATTKKARF
jgi:hypothetical protein